MKKENELRQLLGDAAERSVNYLEGLSRRRTAPSGTEIEALSELGGRLPDAPTETGSVLRLLDEVGSPATVASAGGRFFGFVVGGALPVTVASHWLTDAWDQNVCLFAQSPVGTYLEDVCLTWLVDLLDLPSTTSGAFVTGAQMANFTCLAAARHAVLKRAGWDVESDGLFGAPEVRIVVSEEAHATLLKALALLGMGRNRVVTTSTDSQGRILTGALPSLDQQTIVCTQAGNVNTGSFDPVSEICEVALESGAWVHVDGAFGLWARASSGRRHLATGVDRADSWAIDAHKWLNVPYDSGIALVREPAHLAAAMSISAPYLGARRQREPMQYGPESSRRARAVQIWAALKSLGREGVEDLIERTCRHAERFADGLRRAGYEILNDVVLNQVLVSFGSNAATESVIRSVQNDGTCWCGGTLWHGRAAMRISVSSWRTTDNDVDRSLSTILEIASKEAPAPGE